jgi:hypothetical protein
MDYPRHIDTTSRASYWELSPGLFNAFPVDASFEYVAERVGRYGGYPVLDSIRKLKGDRPLGSNQIIFGG